MKRQTILQIFGMNPVDPEREVGIEIEMEGRRLAPSRMAYWRSVEDGSLRAGGREFVLREPCKRNSVKARLGSLQSALEGNEYVQRESDNCGVHVHINCQNMTPDEVMTFILAYLVVEDLLVDWCAPSRRGNLFCLRASDAEDLVVSLRQAVRNIRDFKVAVGGSYKYAALNILSLQTFGSLEFRALETPKDFGKISEWVEILLTIKDNALTYENPHRLVEAVSFAGPITFFRRLLGPHATKFEKVGLREKLYSGVRRVQDIAYEYEDRPPEIKAKKKPRGRVHPGLGFSEEVEVGPVGEPGAWSASTPFPDLEWRPTEGGGRRPVPPPSPNPPQPLDTIDPAERGNSSRRLDITQFMEVRGARQPRDYTEEWTDAFNNRAPRRPAGIDMEAWDGYLRREGYLPRQERAERDRG